MFLSLKLVYPSIAIQEWSNVPEAWYDIFMRFLVGKFLGLKMCSKIHQNLKTFLITSFKTNALLIWNVNEWNELPINLRWETINLLSTTFTSSGHMQSPFSSPGKVGRVGYIPKDQHFHIYIYFGELQLYKSLSALSLG